MLRFLGNVIWVALGGFWMSIGWLFWALILAITIIGIPFARQCLKLANFSLWPFGRMAVHDPTASPIGIFGAVLWFIPGVIMALGYIVTGLLMCITIIGIPFGIQQMKLAGLAFAPFGKMIVASDDVRRFVAY